MSGGAPSLDPRRLCQVEIHVHDLARAVAFYEAAFGWRAAPAELHQYVVLDVPRDSTFGLSLIPSRTAPDAGRGASKIVLYFAVVDPAAVVARVEAAGGRKRVGPMALAGYGEVWQVEDPEGVVWGLYRQTAAAPLS